MFWLIASKLIDNQFLASMYILRADNLFGPGIHIEHGAVLRVEELEVFCFFFDSHLFLSFKELLAHQMVCRDDISEVLKNKIKRYYRHAWRSIHACMHELMFELKMLRAKIWIDLICCSYSRIWGTTVGLHIKASANPISKHENIHDMRLMQKVSRGCTQMYKNKIQTNKIKTVACVPYNWPADRPTAGRDHQLCIFFFIHNKKRVMHTYRMTFTSSI